MSKKLMLMQKIGSCSELCEKAVFSISSFTEESLIDTSDFITKVNEKEKKYAFLNTEKDSPFFNLLNLFDCYVNVVDYIEEDGAVGTYDGLLNRIDILNPKHFTSLHYFYFTFFHEIMHSFNNKKIKNNIIMQEGSLVEFVCDMGAWICLLLIPEFKNTSFILRKSLKPATEGKLDLSIFVENNKATNTFFTFFRYAYDIVECLYGSGILDEIPSVDEINNYFLKEESE